MVKDEDPDAVINYVLSNNIWELCNGTQNKWGRIFFGYLKLILHCLRRTDIIGFEVTIFNLAPSNKKRCSRHYAKAAKTTEGTGNMVPSRREKREFKFEIEVPRLGMIY